MDRAVDLGTENDERMARLREALALGDGFQLVIVQVEPGEQREEVLRRLAGWAGRHGVPALEVIRLAPGESPVMRLAGEHGGVVLVGLEADRAGQGQRSRELITEFNWSRDRLPELVRGPLVLVVSQRVQTELFEQAPDFYSWRAHTTSIAPQPPRLDRPLLLPWFGPGSNTVPDDPATLEAMIANTATLRPPATRELGRLYARLASARSRRGEHAGVDAALDAAYEAIASVGTSKDRVELLLLRSEAARRRGRADEASAWFEKAQEEARSAASPLLEALTRFFKAHLALDREELEPAATALSAWRAAAQEEGDRGMEASALFLLAALATRPEDATSLLEQALHRYREAGHPAGEVTVLIDLANNATVAGRSDDAEAYARDALTRAKASGSAEAEARAMVTLAWIALGSDHSELAEQTLRRGISDVGVRVTGEIAEVRAELARRRGDDVSAERHFRAALEAYRSAEETWKVAEVSLELGKLGQRTKSWTLALTGFEAADRLGDSRQRAHAALGLVELALNRDEWTAAHAEQLAVATQMLAAVGDATCADAARVYRGGVLAKLGRNAEARAECETALAGAEARGQAEVAARVRELLAKLE